MTASNWKAPNGAFQPARVTSLIDEHLRQNVLQVRAERRVTQWALSGAILALAVVVVFFIWAVMTRKRPDTSSAPVKSRCTGSGFRTQARVGTIVARGA